MAKGQRRLAERSQPGRRRPKSLGVDKKPKLKRKNVSLKNQIRSVERMLRKDLPPNVKEAQEKKLDGLKKEQEAHDLKAKERTIFLRNRKIKFFERRKIERRIRRTEKQQRAAAGLTEEMELAQQLLKLKDDLEYVKFFPKTVEYVPLFVGGDDEKTEEKREKTRELIKANKLAAAASGKDLEETGSDDDALMDASEDDFFLSGSSSDADADDELTDRSTREQASSASYKAASGMSSDERTQRQISARALMPPPRASKKFISSSLKGKKFGGSSHIRSYSAKTSETSTSSTTSNSNGFRKQGSDPHTGFSDNVGSNSDARKPRRKRRPKKKKQKGGSSAFFVFPSVDQEGKFHNVK